MGEVSNDVIAMLSVILIASLTLQFYVYFSLKGAKTALVSSGRLSMCIENNPEIAPIGQQVAKTGKEFTYVVMLKENVNGSYWFTDDTDLFDIDPYTGTISFTPNESQVGEYVINISVYNSCNKFSDDEIMNLKIELSNQAPYFDPPLPENFTIYQNEHFVYDVNATDPDNDTLTFLDNTSMFEIDPTTGIIDFIPVQEDVGNHSVKFWVIDTADNVGSAVSLFIIIDVNDAPELELPPMPYKCWVNDTCYIDINASDVDTTLPHDLTFYDDSPLFDINSTTGEINFTPTDSELGAYEINISVTDGELWDSEILTLIITDENRPPQITSWYPENYTITIKESESQYFNITKWDPDKIDRPYLNTFWYLDGSKILEGSDEYTYYASCTSAGWHNVTVMVYDGEDYATHEWEVGVGEYCEPERERPARRPSPPPPPPPCIENWRCTEWSVCSVYGVQTRTCTDLSNCGTTFKKPIEVRNCTYVPVPSCSDGVKNCHHGSCEVLVDCGGPCPPCPTCSDGVKNCHVNGQCEEGIDCGGPCPPCRVVEKAPLKPVCGNKICEKGELFSCPSDCGNQLFLFMVLALGLPIGAALFYLYGSVLITRIKLMPLFMWFRRRRVEGISRKKLIGLSGLNEIKLLQTKVGEEDLRVIAKKLSMVMRDFLSRYFNIDYNFTYVQLNEELSKRKIEKKARERVVRLIMKLSELEYGGAEISISMVLHLFSLCTGVIKELTGIGMEEVERMPRSEMRKVKRVEYREVEENIERETDVEELRKAIDEAEKAVEEKDIDRAVQLYSKIKKMYENIPASKRALLAEETVRIMKIYNEIIKYI